MAKIVLVQISSQLLDKTGQLNKIFYTQTLRALLFKFGG
jgi:hypothetical protein